MNEKEYLTLDIYDSVEVDSVLRFVPYLHWSLFSIQDVFSRSDVFKNNFITTKKKETSAPSKSWSGNFADAVNSSSDPSIDESSDTETHIVSYTRITLERDPSFLDRPRLALTEKTWIRLTKLQRAIARRAEVADNSLVHATNNGGNGAVIFGLIVFGLFLPVFIFGLYLLDTMPPAVETGSLYSFTNLFLYIGGGVMGFGLLIFILGLISSINSSSGDRKNRKAIKHSVSDYRAVSANKRSFEKLVMEGKTPSINAEWLYSLCVIYDVPCPSPNKQ